MCKYDELVQQEGIICQHRKLWHNNLRCLTDHTNGACIRLTNAHVNSQLQAALNKPTSIEQLCGKHLDSSSAEDSCTSEDPTQCLCCQFCRWTHKSKDCDMPHWICTL